MMDLSKLQEKCEYILKNKKRAVIVITGLCGSGKSTLGKEIRRKGFGSFKQHQIAVIDDDVMSINLFLMRPRVKIKSDQKDELRPFFKFLPPYVKLIFYVSTTPFARISKADILCILNIDEKEREKRLKKRNRDDEEKLLNFINQKELDLGNLEYDYRIMF
jgi:hypothetical protein